MEPTEIEPGIAAFLDAVNAAGGPGPAEQGVDQLRMAYQLTVALDGDPEEVASAVDGEVAGVPVRTYLPAAGGEPVGTLVWFHGGGWVIGDLDTADRTCRKLANRAGARVVSVDYRRAPEHPFPAALDDCWAVTEAIAADPANGPVAVGGDSAGGNLAAAVALRARDRGVALAHQVLAYPVTDVSTEHPSIEENAEGKFLTRETMRWFIDQYVPNPADRTNPEVAPLLAPDLAGVAPAHVLTAGHDPLRDEGDAYAAALRAAGVPVEHDEHPALIHLFLALSALTPAADAGLARAGELLAAALQKAGSSHQG